MPIKRKSRIAERREKLDGGVTYSEWKNRYIEKSPLVSVNGLSSGNIQWKTGGGSPPRLIEQITFSPEVIQETLEKYEQPMANSPFEHAVIITKKGKVYHCAGDEHGIPK